MSLKINGRIVPKEHEPYFKETYNKIYASYVKKQEDLYKEWLTLYPILIDLGIDVPASVWDESKGVKTVIASNTVLTNREAMMSIGKDILGLFDDYHNLIEDSIYESNWSWLKKADYILKIAGKPLTPREIIDVMIHKYEPTLSRQTAVNSLPATLSVAWKENKIHRDKRDNGEYEYSLIK